MPIVRDRGSTVILTLKEFLEEDPKRNDTALGVIGCDGVQSAGEELGKAAAWKLYEALLPHVYHFQPSLTSPDVDSSVNVDLVEL